MQNDPVAFSQPGVVAVTQHFAAAAGDDLRHWFYFQMNRRVEQPKQQHTRIHTPLTLGTQGSFNSFFFLGSWNRLCAEGFQRLIVLVRFSSSPCRINLKISSFAQYGTYLHELNPESMIWLESATLACVLITTIVGERLEWLSVPHQVVSRYIEFLWLM
jgi:hypothetical protein